MSDVEHYTGRKSSRDGFVLYSSESVCLSFTYVYVWRRMEDSGSLVFTVGCSFACFQANWFLGMEAEAYSIHLSGNVDLKTIRVCLFHGPDSPLWLHDVAGGGGQSIPRHFVPWQTQWCTTMEMPVISQPQDNVYFFLFPFDQGEGGLIITSSILWMGSFRIRQWAMCP